MCVCVSMYTHKGVVTATCTCKKVVHLFAFVS